MGNLVKDLAVSEMVATLEVLASHGVRKEHLDLLRKDTKRANVVAQVIIAGYVVYDSGGGKLRVKISNGKSLKKLISSGSFDYVNSDITATNFPDVGVKTDFKVYDFRKTVSSDFAIEQMTKEGYRPANLRELLNWMSASWNGKDWVVALGQVWQGSGGSRGVPYLYFSGERELRLPWRADDWDARCRFLAVRK